jgi:hypothetical protein
MSSVGNAFAMKMQHTKSRSEIPSNFSRNVATLKQFLRDENERPMRTDIMMRTAPSGENVYLMKDANPSALNSQESVRKINMRKKRKPSINSINSESNENSKSYLSSEKFSQQKDGSRLKKEPSIKNEV